MQRVLYEISRSDYCSIKFQDIWHIFDMYENKAKGFYDKNNYNSLITPGFSV